MISQGESDLGEMSMRELLRMEVESQSRVLIDTLLELEHANMTDKHLERMMRAAHSMKGGARIADLEPAVKLAHVMEDFFVATRAGQVALQRDRVNVLLKAVDLMNELAQSGARQDDIPDELVGRASAMVESVLTIAQNPPSSLVPEEAEAKFVAVVEPMRDEYGNEPFESRVSAPGTTARTVRVSVESMNRLMAQVGELIAKSKVASGIRTESLQAHRRVHEITVALEELRLRLVDLAAGTRWLAELDEVITKIGHMDEFYSRSADVLETHDAQTTEISRKMQRELIAQRMQPFGDVAQGFKRLVRDLGQTLGKEVTLEIQGNEVGVDRDILERLNAPLTHLIQNAVDHGIDNREERIAANKSVTGSVRLIAQHGGGLLSIVVEDDGRGIDLEQLRQVVVNKKLVSEAVAVSLQEQELLEFLFLPDFTMSQRLSDISGRGVGLNLVRHTLQEVRGNVLVSSQAGKGTRFEITLPVTLIVVRCLVVEIAGELFALPAGRIVRALQVEHDTVQSLENRQYLMLDGHQIGLVSVAELLDLSGGEQRTENLAVVVLAKGLDRYGLVVDRLVGERQLVERPLNTGLGKVEDVASVSMLDDGSPVLIINVDDLLHSIERLASGRILRKVSVSEESKQVTQSKRVLVVDDSITVREVERSLLSVQGYVVDVAVDGAEGWNALRTGKYDLVVTDVDMPRMDGIELVKLIRTDARLRELPVIIVSYKDREEDRLNGLDAGADRYLTKGSFQDDTFVQTVSELIGESLP